MIVALVNDADDGATLRHSAAGTRKRTRPRCACCSGLERAAHRHAGWQRTARQDKPQCGCAAPLGIGSRFKTRRSGRSADSYAFDEPRPVVDRAARGNRASHAFRCGIRRVSRDVEEFRQGDSREDAENSDYNDQFDDRESRIFLHIVP